MKVDNHFGSIWDELPKSQNNSRKIPETKQEALDLYQAAEVSVNKSTMKIWDSHNDMMKKSAELRKISDRKKALEKQTQKRREENHELMIETALKNEQRRKFLIQK